MQATTVTLAGKRFVILPETEYQSLKSGRPKPRRAASAAAKDVKEARPRVARPHRMTKQDKGDVAEANRRRAEPGPNIPWEQIKSERGV